MDYQLLEIKQSQYQFLIVSMSSQNPFEYIKDVESNLQDISADGVILFDMLTYLGNNSNRFMEAKFNGRHFVSESFKVVEISKSCEIRSVTRNTLVENEFCLIGTVLSEIQKDMLIGGLSI